ncbi:MAG TPA: hypothetical protein VNU45_07655 [Rummeliibacillus sp.]|nr:hypothetical protein [Rummeliibacillus sp.]
MAIYTVKSLNKIDYGATGVDEILQNVAFIMGTFKNSCPLQRELGWIPAIDEPIDQAESTDEAAVLEAIEEFEPRAEVLEITTLTNEEGKSEIVVKVGVVENG